MDGGLVVVCFLFFVFLGKNFRCGYYLMWYVIFLRNFYVKGRIIDFFCIDKYEIGMNCIVLVVYNYYRFIFFKVDWFFLYGGIVVVN